MPTREQATYNAPMENMDTSTFNTSLCDLFIEIANVTYNQKNSGSPTVFAFIVSFQKYSFIDILH